MEETKSQRINRFCNIFAKSRYVAGKSQEFMAAELGVSKRTVQNWEKGISFPSFFEATEWFHALGLNPMPYYLEYVYPHNFDGISPQNSDEDIKQAMELISKHLSNRELRILLYIFYGSHGSSPNMALELILAHLHCPMKDRILHASVITKDFELAKELDNLVCPEYVLPKDDLLNVAIQEATDSVMKNKSGYTYKDFIND